MHVIKVTTVRWIEFILSQVENLVGQIEMVDVLKWNSHFFISELDVSEGSSLISIVTEIDEMPLS